MISISLDKIVITKSSRKGYNLKSLKNLRQNNTKPTTTNDITPKVKSKLKSLLTNWLHTEGAYIKEQNKKNKNKKNTAANTAPPHIPPQKPTHKAQRGGTSSVQPFRETKEGCRSSIKQKEKFKIRNFTIKIKNKKNEFN